MTEHDCRKCTITLTGVSLNSWPQTSGTLGFCEPEGECLLKFCSLSASLASTSPGSSGCYSEPFRSPLQSCSEFRQGAFIRLRLSVTGCGCAREEGVSLGKASQSRASPRETQLPLSATNTPHSRDTSAHVALAKPSCSSGPPPLLFPPPVYFLRFRRTCLHFPEVCAQAPRCYRSLP